MTIDAANRSLIISLGTIYDPREAASISSLLLEHLTGMSPGSRVMHKTDPLTDIQEDLLQKYLSELLQNRPVQYVLGESWFGGLRFFANEHVLIPRPETEELADWLVRDTKRSSGLSVLDVGTGSGCIAIYIKKKRTDFHICAIDISAQALAVAKKNALLNNATVDFLSCDIRDPKQWDQLPLVDLIISNPPYIPAQEYEALEKHVKDFEPALALVVPDADPILFYRILAALAIEKLNPGGFLYLEVHPDYSQSILDWYQEDGFLMELKKDFSGNNRMIKAWRSGKFNS